MYEHITQMEQRGRPKAPSTTIDTPWLWASAPHTRLANHEALDGGSSGKWLWFLPVRAVDAGWRLVKQSVEEGKLGPAAKVATLGNCSDGDSTRLPVIVYTADCADETDVQRVLIGLRGIGVKDALAYKTDEATRLGEYGNRTSLYTSPVNSVKIIRRTPRYSSGSPSRQSGQGSS